MSNGRARSGKRLVAPVITGLLGLLITPATSIAQVAVNPDALSQLKPSEPAPVPTPRAGPVHRPAARPPPAHHAAAAADKKPATQANTARATTAPPPPVTVAPAPPAEVTLAPLVAAPPKPAAPLPPVPVINDATGVANSISNGVRITFGSGSSDLNPAMVDAIRALARAMDATAGSEVSLYSYSSGPPDDPSTPRRLALARALAVRAVLISEGIASTRIYPRVQPPSASAPAAAQADPPDRVDMVMTATQPA